MQFVFLMYLSPSPQYIFDIVFLILRWFRHSKSRKKVCKTTLCSSLYTVNNWKNWNSQSKREKTSKTRKTEKDKEKKKSEDSNDNLIDKMTGLSRETKMYNQSLRKVCTKCWSFFAQFFIENGQIIIQTENNHFAY